MNKIEKELENWLFENPNNFEDGMRWVSKQRPVFWRGQKIGRTDLIGIDKDNNFTIVELKANILTSHIIGQVIGYYKCLSSQEGYSNYRICCIGKKISTIFRISSEWFTSQTGIPIEIKIWSKEKENYLIENYNPETHNKLYIQFEEY
jgi:hypothetical protein